jgi:hypothetical protein
MVGKLKKHIEDFLRDPPGRRFIELHHRWKEPAATPEAAWRKAAFIGAGFTLLLTGMLLSLPPGFPGFLLWFPGMVMLISRLKAAAILLDDAEILLRRLIARLRR